jgi:hypothetical protein
VLPLATMGTLWPLRLAFLVARPALERLADGAAAGQALAGPQWAGPYRLVQSAVDPASGEVALMTDPNPSGAKGFVRVNPGIPWDRRGPILGTDLDVELGWGWEYRQDD